MANVSVKVAYILAVMPVFNDKPDYVEVALSLADGDVAGAFLLLENLLDEQSNRQEILTDSLVKMLATHQKFIQRDTVAMTARMMQSCLKNDIITRCIDMEQTINHVWLCVNLIFYRDNGGKW